MRTVFRFRPKPANAKNNNNSENELEIDADSREVSIVKGSNQQQLTYNADKVFDTNTTQSDIFKKIGERIVDNCIEGYNSSVFAYGQTGSGKTHTMIGYNKDEGLILRSFRYLFNQLNGFDEIESYSVTLSAYEIYNEKVFDRLKEENIALKIRSTGEITGLTSVSVQTFKDCINNLNYAIKTRTVASTNMNNTSSRSHLIITLNIKQQQKVTNATKTSKLNFIDLAGSERISKTDAKGQRLKEAQKINASLTSLGRLVDALVKKSKYLPYRDSSLTLLLRDSLGGNSNTYMIGCCSIEDRHINETAATMSFIARSRKIQNKPIINKKYSGKAVEALTKQFNEYKLNMEGLLEKQKLQYESEIKLLKDENEKLKGMLSEKQKEQLKLESSFSTKIQEKVHEIETLKKEIAKSKSMNSKLQFSNMNMTNTGDNIDLKKLGKNLLKTMFLEYCEKGDLENLKKILPYCDINCQNSNGEGGLALAIKNNNIHVLKYLLSNNANPNVVDRDSVSVLMVATVYSKIECCKLLLKYGADVDYNNSLGCNVLHICASRGYTGLFDEYLKLTKQINAQSKRGWTHLMFASKAGFTKIVQSLLECKNIDVNATNSAKCTALILASYAGRIDVVQLLLKHGADHTLKDKFGMSAMIWSHKKKNTQIMKILNDYGSKLSLKDRIQSII